MANVPSDPDATMRGIGSGKRLSPTPLRRHRGRRSSALLEAQELRLLAAAIGDHLPVELAERVEALRRRRRALELMWGEPA
jgi:hypothetical protein